MAVRYRVLGPVDAVDADGRPLPLGGERQRALLAALLARPGEVVSSDRLAHLLWGDEQPDNPAGALHSQVARLRQALRAALTPREARLGDGRGLLTRPPGYLLALEPEQVDAGRFERLVAEATALGPAERPRAAKLLEEALGLWRGPALAEFADQPWAQAEAARLEELRLAATEALIDLRLAGGGHAGLVGELEGLVAAHPTRERLRGQLMVALYRSGRQADALGAYQQAREALALRRGPAYAGFADQEVAQLEAIRLEEARLAAQERHGAALLEAGRPADAVPVLEAFVAEHPLREQARATLMRALYALGRQAEALDTYQDYRQRLAGDLGLEPSPALQRLQAQVLRQELSQGAAPAEPGPPQGLAGLRVRYLPVDGGPPIAWATAGRGPRLVVLPGWVSSLEVMASGRDPRSSLIERLARRLEVVLYDRRGTGLSGGQADFGLPASVQELRAVVEAAGAPASLLAMSGAGPIALALAAERPDLVHRLVLHGTYASGPAVFISPELGRVLVAMVRTHWGMGSTLIADLYRPGSSGEAARHLARVLRDSADREVAAGYLEAIYQADVAALLPRVRAPALVLHYRGDRVVPFAGGQQLAAALPDATFLPLDGAFHLPDAPDLERVVDAVAGFVASAR